jgi:hypothetical protein
MIDVSDNAEVAYQRLVHSEGIVPDGVSKHEKVAVLERLGTKISGIPFTVARVCMPDLIYECILS